MRVPPSRNRRSGQSVTSLAVTSVFVNIILTGALIYAYRGNSALWHAETLSGAQRHPIVESLRSEIRNATASLENAIVALQDKDKQIVAAEDKCKQKIQAAAGQSLKLQQEAETLHSQIRQADLDQGKAAEQRKLWLTIGIPTIPRKNNTDYLTRTLGSLLEELPLDESDLLYAKVKVVVMNNRPGLHTVWQQVRDRIHSPGEAEDGFVRKGRLYTHFVDNPGTVQDPAPDAEEPDDNHNPTSRPGREVRRQTCDLISLLELAQPMSTYYAFMEDDFRVCPYMLRILSYAVRKLNTSPEYGKWLGLRFSYGMNGILVHNSDLNSLTSYLRKHTARLPPDLLWTEWYTGRRLELRQETRGRKLAVYRYNLLDHLGARSSFSVRTARPRWPRCYHPMSDVWSLARSEQFNERRCGATDISPCPKSDGGELWIKHPISWPNITEGADLDHAPLLYEEIQKDAADAATRIDAFVSTSTDTS